MTVLKIYFYTWENLYPKFFFNIEVLFFVKKIMICYGDGI